VNPVALLGAAPVFVPAPEWLRDRTLTSIELTSAATTVAQPRDLRRRLFVAAGTAALALGVIVFMAIGRVPDRVPIEPADAEATTTGTGVSRPPAGFLAPPPPPTTTAVDAPSASQAPATIPSASGPAMTTPRASSDAPTETDSVTVSESPPARPRPPESASSVVDEPAQDPDEPSTAPQPSTPQPTAPARTVPREPIKTFTPDTPVVTTNVPIG
jgi:hypothetical protein